MNVRDRPVEAGEDREGGEAGEDREGGEGRAILQSRTQRRMVPGGHEVDGW